MKKTTPGKHEAINKFIRESSNGHTLKYHQFPKDFEDFLGIEAPERGNSRIKPLNVIWHYRQGKIADSKIEELAKLVEGLVES